MGNYFNAALMNSLSQGMQERSNEQQRLRQLIEQIRIWQMQQGTPTVNQPTVSTEQRTSLPMQQTPEPGIMSKLDLLQPPQPVAPPRIPIDLRNTPSPVETPITPQLISLIKNVQRPPSMQENVQQMLYGDVEGYEVQPKVVELTPAQKSLKEHREWQRQFAEKKESMSISPDIKTALSQANAYSSQARSLEEGDPNRTLLQEQSRGFLKEVTRLSKQRYGTNVPQFILTEIQVTDPAWYESFFGKTGKENVVVASGSPKEKAIQWLKDAGELQTEQNIKDVINKFKW